MRVTTNSFVLMLATPWVRRPRAHVAHRALARRDLASQGRRNRLATVIHHTSPEANRPHNLRVVNLQRPLLLFCSCGTDLAVRLRLSPALRLRSLLQVPELVAAVVGDTKYGTPGLAPAMERLIFWC